MDISISVRLMDKYITIMAIPLYVPEGVGPVIDANNNSNNNINTATQGQNTTAVNNINNTPNTTVPSDTPAATGIHQVELRDSTRIDLNTFPRQLFAELSALYNSFCVVPPQPTVANPISPFNMASINNQDNQGSSTAASGGDGGRRSTQADQVVSRPQLLLPLPDIIQCHAGLSLEASYRGCRVRRHRGRRRTTGGVSNNDERRRRLTPHPRHRSSNNSEQADHSHHQDHNDRREDGRGDDSDGDDDDEDDDEEELNSDWTVELKLLVGPWRQAGMELRAIADRYQLENTRRRERQRRESRRHLQLRIILNMAIPAAAVLAWGISWLRRQ